MSGPLTGHGFLFSIARQRYVPSRVSLVRLQPEALYTSLSMGDCDVQGMLHLRLPAPGLLRLPRQPTGSHGPVCWRGIRDASAQATDMTDAAGTMACAAPPAPSPTIGRLNASSSSKPDWTQTIRHACAACASVATTARPRERNLQASTVEAFADSSHLLHACGTSSQADDVRRAPQA